MGAPRCFRPFPTVFCRSISFTGPRCACLEVATGILSVSPLAVTSGKASRTALLWLGECSESDAPVPVQPVVGYDRRSTTLAHALVGARTSGYSVDLFDSNWQISSACFSLLRTVPVRNGERGIPYSHSQARCIERCIGKWVCTY